MGGRLEAQGRGYGDICMHVADSLCCTTETNSIVKQLYSNKDVVKKKKNKDVPSGGILHNAFLGLHMLMYTINLF